MAEDKYAWQKDTYRLWKENNYRGLLKGCVSAGKSRAGCNCIEGYLNDFGKDKEIWKKNIITKKLKEYMM